jgi:hypothetical protein
MELSGDGQFRIDYVCVTTQQPINLNRCRIAACLASVTEGQVNGCGALEALR